MLKVNELYKKKLPTQTQKNNMENTLNQKENALRLIAQTVEDFDDLQTVAAETGIELATLEIMYYSII